MAVKDHTLDGRIIEAAKEEFLRCGYQKASLNRIARNAGLTTGAVYTRYKGKDDLFCSLVQEVIDTVAGKMQAIGEHYRQAHDSGDPEQILTIIREEMKICQELMADHYEACVLFYCKSGGSSVETMLEQSMESKTGETVKYFRSLVKPDLDLDLDGIGILMSEQFHFFRQILARGYSREKAMSCMKLVEVYQEAGWKALFDRML